MVLESYGFSWWIATTLINIWSYHRFLRLPATKFWESIVLKLWLKLHSRPGFGGLQCSCWGPWPAVEGIDLRGPTASEGHGCLFVRYFGLHRWMESPIVSPLRLVCSCPFWKLLRRRGCQVNRWYMMIWIKLIRYIVSSEFDRDETCPP